MRTLWMKALLLALATSFAAAQQQTDSLTPTAPADAQPERVKVYAVGPGVTAPELLPLDLPPFGTDKCGQHVDGTVELSLLVDTAGRARNVMFLHPLGTDLDRFALRIAGEDRFKPGTRDGAAVVVGQSLEVSIKACMRETEDSTGAKTYLLHLIAQPEQKLGDHPRVPKEAVLAPLTAAPPDPLSKDFPHYHLGGGVTPPVPLNNVEAELSDDARHAHYSGQCLISVIVDANGMPQNVRIVRPLDHGLSERALESVKKYRFKPAMKDGEPVPFVIVVEVNFQQYN
jgi:TonB family protein